MHILITTGVIWVHSMCTFVPVMTFLRVFLRDGHFCQTLTILGFPDIQRCRGLDLWVMTQDGHSWIDLDPWISWSDLLV